MHPLTTIDGDSAGTILIQGQGTIHRQAKLPLAARVGGHAWAEEERALSRSVRHSPYRFTQHRQLKPPGKRGSGGAGGQQIPHEPAVCPGSQEGEPHPGSNTGQAAWKRGNSATAFSIGEASHAALGAATSETNVIGEKKMV